MYYLCYRSPDVFPEPDTFNPDRFLKKGNDATFYSLIPFILGNRMCMGSKLAKLEIKTIVMVLLKKFHFETIAGTKFTTKVALIMHPYPSLKLKVSPI